MDEQAAKKIESVKAYYQQQVTQLRSLTQQLAQTDLPPAKRAQLTIQQENLQRDLSVFVENVLKPLAAATNSNKDSPRLPPPPAPRPAAGIRPPAPASVPRPPFKPTPTPQPHSVQAIQQQQWLFSQRVQNSRQFNDAFYTQPRSLSRTDVYVPRGPVDEQVRSEGKAAPLVAGGEVRQAKTLEQMVAGIAAERGVPPPPITPEFERRTLALADTWIDRVAMSAALLARHRNATAVGKRDLELALDRAAGLGQPSSQAILLNVRKVLKRPTTGNNPHQNRMAQLRKHLSSIKET